VATDLNQPMLGHATTKQGIERVRFQRASMTVTSFMVSITAS
jgi:hypothetical protein